ncbi:hypothetical protein F383_36498 [Gossypium arboreum]|nr:hypothetical protein F383_36498 [Gossypium arboreum]
MRPNNLVHVVAYT